jgi:hypothetical protein
MMNIYEEGTLNFWICCFGETTSSVTNQGRIQDFKLGETHLKKLRGAEGGAKIVGVFRVKESRFYAPPPPLDPPLLITDPSPKKNQNKTKNNTQTNKLTNKQTKTNSKNTNKQNKYKSIYK